MHRATSRLPVGMNCPRRASGGTRRLPVGLARAGDLRPLPSSYTPLLVPAQRRSNPRGPWRRYLPKLHQLLAYRRTVHEVGRKLQVISVSLDGETRLSRRLIVRIHLQERTSRFVCIGVPAQQSVYPLFGAREPVPSWAAIGPRVPVRARPAPACSEPGIARLAGWR